MPAFPPDIIITVAPTNAKPRSQVLLRKEFKVRANRTSVPAIKDKPSAEADKRPSSSKAVEGSANARATGSTVMMTRPQKFAQRKVSISSKSCIVAEQSRSRSATRKSLNAQASEYINVGEKGAEIRQTTTNSDSHSLLRENAWRRY